METWIMIVFAAIVGAITAEIARYVKTEQNVHVEEEARRVNEEARAEEEERRRAEEFLNSSYATRRAVDEARRRAEEKRRVEEYEARRAEERLWSDAAAAYRREEAARWEAMRVDRERRWREGFDALNDRLEKESQERLRAVEEARRRAEEQAREYRKRGEEQERQYNERRASVRPDNESSALKTVNSYLRKIGKKEMVNGNAAERTAAYRHLAVRFHPDQGGSEREMKDINAAMAALKEHFRD